jgi:hypothetical protein
MNRLLLSSQKDKLIYVIHYILTYDKFHVDPKLLQVLYSLLFFIIFILLFNYYHNILNNFISFY